MPVIVDPSHGTGKRTFIGSISKAAIAAGADGLLIEAENKPEEAATDADQTISTSDLGQIIKDARLVAQAVGRAL